MEPPQASRPYGAEGRKATHDFLSLYTHSPVQHDPRSSSHGGSLRTHNFLQPLEKDDKSMSVKEDNAVGINIQKPPSQAASLLSTEHVLPGGIGTYSLSHISSFNRRVPKPEGIVYGIPPAATSSTDRNNENSNCSSYTGGSDSGFSLWEDSLGRKGKTGKENLGDINVTKEAIAKSGQWSLERPSESSPNHHNSYSSRSSSQPPAPKNQSFMDMLKSARLPPGKEEEDEEDITLGKEGTSQRGELRVKVDGKRSSDQKANTPRSKHSATEQRRRCKINDRFQSLRQLIPHSDQKRDKASFLLEVIEYIQFLQEKVLRYESSPPGWSSGEPTKLTTSWQRSSPNPTEGLTNQPRSVHGSVLMFNAKPEEKVYPTIGSGKQQDLAELDSLACENNNNNVVSFKGLDQQNVLTDKAAPSVSSTVPSQPEIFAPFRNGNTGVIQPGLGITSDSEKNASLSQLQLWQSQQQTPACSSERYHRDQELAVEGGTISISSVYSQGLLKTLTQALQSSGVDLSQASISVQVDVGKRANNGQIAPRTTDKPRDGEFDHSSGSVVRERGVESRGGEDFNQPSKRLKKMAASS